MATGSRKRLLKAVDCLLALFVFFPMICMYWRGSWDLITYYVFPGQEPFCYMVQSAVGAGTAFTYYVLPLIHKCVKRENKCIYWLVTRLLMMYHGILYMFLWRGVWGLADFYLTRVWTWSLMGVGLLILILFPLRIIRQTMWPPFVVCIDRGDLLVATNRFGAETKNACRYFLDSTFTALITNILAIFTWRTIWCVWDDLLYPEDLLLSDMVSFGLGVGGVLLLFALQRGLAAVSVSLENSDRMFLRLVWEGVIYVIVLAALSALWRGGWNLNLRYLISCPRVGGLVHHLCGTLLLLMFSVYSMVGGCGCALDGGDPGGGAFFPIQYVSSLCGDKEDEDDDDNDSMYKEDPYTGDPCSQKPNNRFYDKPYTQPPRPLLNSHPEEPPHQDPTRGLRTTPWYNRDSPPEDFHMLVPKRSPVNKHRPGIIRTGTQVTTINNELWDQRQMRDNAPRLSSPASKHVRIMCPPDASSAAAKSTQDFGDPWVRRTDIPPPHLYPTKRSAKHVHYYDRV